MHGAISRTTPERTHVDQLACGFSCEVLLGMIDGSSSSLSRVARRDGRVDGCVLDMAIMNGSSDFVND